jgi:hypothetical protein
MKTIRKVLVIAACLGAASTANAQLGALGGMLGGNKLSAGTSGDIGADVNAFINKSVALSLLSSRAVIAINSAFDSDEKLADNRAKLASITGMTNPKEQLAKIAELYNSQQAIAEARLKSGEMEKNIGALSAEKKKLIGQALLNFGIGSLQAVDLTRSGQAIIQSAGANPMNLPKIVPVKDALPVLGKVAGDAGGFMIGVAKLAKGANISVQPVKADSKPADIMVI